ncbi:MAG: hybrid sensor histidine kinase/response regulator [Bdellovibrionales bacterium]|nr:hybrid sensor histidine kinase/response regulator [Bdellovibrionales bacterium]
MKKNWFFKKNTLSRKIFFGMGITALLSSLFLFATLLILDYEQTKESNHNIIREQIATINNNLESYRITGKYEYIAKNLYRLNLVDHVALYDKNCEILFKIPLNKVFPPNCKIETNGWLKTELNDDYSSLKFIQTKSNFNFLKKFWASFKKVLFIILGFSFVFALISTMWLKNKIEIPIKQIMKAILKLSPEKERKGLIEDENVPEELKQILMVLFRKEKQLGIAQEELLKKRELEINQKIALQVAHDIRSPLTALEMASKELDSLSNNKKAILKGAIGRIQDIANNLLNKNRNINSKGPQKPYLISDAINNLLSEKRLQYSGRKVKFNFEINQTNYSLFTTFDLSQLNRILSNLINNSVEAIESENEGLINICLNDKSKYFTIIIKDNGKGIHPDILKSLKENPRSFGKDSGNGLGLSHAFEKIKAYGGSIKIKSQPRKGTEIYLNIPKSSTPSWFINNINLLAIKKIVILDDDLNIHEVWKEHFQNKNIDIISFYETSNIQKYVENKNIEDTLFLCDLELNGNKNAGINFILNNNIQEKSVLVTSHFSNDEVINFCMKDGIRILPKSAILYTPINISQKTVIHIEDDPYLRMAWEESAQNAGIRYKGFSSYEEVLPILRRLKEDFDFYIDNELGEGKLTGVEAASDLNKKGFSNLYLTTGYSNNKDFNFPFLKGVFGKTPSF